MIILFIKLLMGHALADFALQSDAMAKGKNRNRKPDLALIPPGQSYVPCWPYWLTAHALIHGMTVWLITGSIGLGIAETVCHWLIDFFKCENQLTVHEDQGLHVLCKVIWAILATGIGLP
jgi:hypothetical protein